MGLLALDMSSISQYTILSFYKEQSHFFQAKELEECHGYHELKVQIFSVLINLDFNINSLAKKVFD